MHFITGGSFNGKKRWALNFYQLTFDKEEMKVVRFYDKEDIEDLLEVTKPFLLLEGIEYWIRHKIMTLEEDKIYDYFYTFFKRLKDWENSGDNHQVILIGSDITKGIVPIKKEDRLWRDVTGRIFQEAVRMADRVDVVWYGLHDQLK
ncbi:MAG: bifunctional adenosylcobinamide kinase/adenosylcobinamide-phosphate guanylyltransferase [Bacillus sp. (in: firmicutes)]